MVFPAGLFLLAIIIYFGMTLVYEPALTNQINDTQTQISKLSESIPSGDEQGLATYYSQLANLQGVLRKHVLFSQFLTWLEHNTEANVYYSQFSFSSGSQVTITANARSQADMAQQIAIFEASPRVRRVVVSNTGVSQTGYWQFTATLVVDPSILIPGTPVAAGTAPTASSTHP